MIKIYLCLLVLGILLYDKSEGCGRVPATPPPPVTSTTAPTQRPISSNETIRGEKCTEAEKNQTLCVTGQGECFVYVIGYMRKPSCHCTRNYTGVRCELLNIEVLFPSKDSVATAGIAASIAVIVIVAVVFIGVLIVYYRRKRRRNRMAKKPEQPNGKPLLLPENPIQPRTVMQTNSNGNYFPPEEKVAMFRTTSV